MRIDSHTSSELASRKCIEGGESSRPSWYLSYAFPRHVTKELNNLTSSSLLWSFDMPWSVFDWDKSMANVIVETKRMLQGRPEVITFMRSSVRVTCFLQALLSCIITASWEDHTSLWCHGKPSTLIAFIAGRVDRDSNLACFPCIMSNAGCPSLQFKARVSFVEVAKWCRILWSGIRSTQKCQNTLAWNYLSYWN